MQLHCVAHWQNLPASSPSKMWLNFIIHSHAIVSFKNSTVCRAKQSWVRPKTTACPTWLSPLHVSPSPSALYSTTVCCCYWCSLYCCCFPFGALHESTLLLLVLLLLLLVHTQFSLGKRADSQPATTSQSISQATIWTCLTHPQSLPHRELPVPALAPYSSFISIAGRSYSSVAPQSFVSCLVSQS